MQLKIKNILIAFLALTSLTCFSQESKNYKESRLIDSSLVKRNFKILILKQDENAEVITDRKSFIKSCKAYQKYYQTDLGKEFLEYLEKNNSQIVSFDQLKFDENLESAYKNIYQSQILQNKCLVLNKKSNKLEKKVVADFYGLDDNNYGLEFKTENGIVILRTLNFNCF